MLSRGLLCFTIKYIVKIIFHDKFPHLYLVALVFNISKLLLIKSQAFLVNHEICFSGQCCHSCIKLNLNISEHFLLNSLAVTKCLVLEHVSGMSTHPFTQFLSFSHECL